MVSPICNDWCSGPDDPARFIRIPSASCQHSSSCSRDPRAPRSSPLLMMEMLSSSSARPGSALPGSLGQAWAQLQLLQLLLHDEMGTAFRI